MGFFSDLGKGIGNVIKAPFEGIGAALQGLGNGIGAILHGPQGAANQSATSYLQGRSDQLQVDSLGAQGMMMGMGLLSLQSALQQNFMLNAGAYPCGCR